MTYKEFTETPASAVDRSEANGTTDGVPFSTRRPSERPPLKRVVPVLRNDIAGVRFQFLAVQAAVSAVPRMTFGWLRSYLYRSAGLQIGARTRIYGKIDVEGVGDILANVTIGDGCLLTTPLYLNASDKISIGHRVTIGHHAMIITDSHQTDDPERRAGPRISRPVVIEDGAWVGARATILPGVTLGRGCIVAAGAVVNRDVPAHTLAAGVPARFVKRLPE
jgi:acetyltransferase-like isoleucine patch superfamily enzyme